MVDEIDKETDASKRSQIPAPARASGQGMGRWQPDGPELDPRRASIRQVSMTLLMKASVSRGPQDFEHI